MKKVVISCGCIPAKLDCVKYITNRFKGGLAFKTAKYLLDSKLNVTIVKWKYTDLPKDFPKCKVVDVEDVFDYYKWYENNAKDYDAFIMAGAIANLTPSNPYINKFPSHNYKVGEKFDIQFEIAPRAIDIIKKVNPRACLIGYKLNDCDKDELISIAKTTLKESKANIIFANTPAQAKTKKIALTLDGSVFEVDFDEHLNLIKQVINSHFFTTKIVDINTLELTEDLTNKINLAKEVVKKFEKTIDVYGTIAIKIDKNSFVTTSRGHTGEPVFVCNVDIKNKIVYATGKATLNTPVLYAFIKKYDYVIHRHDTKVTGEIVDDYVFPGTYEEYKQVNDKLKVTKKNTIIEKHHGYIKGFNFYDIDWKNYYNDFPKRYFSENQQIKNYIEKYKDKETLEVGSNTKNRTKYVLDKYIKSKNIVGYDDLKTHNFDLIVIENAINYLNENELNQIKSALSPNGILIANTFDGSPTFRVRENECVYTDDIYVNHYLIINEEKVIYHKFFKRDMAYYKSLGFTISKYGNNSLLLIYKNEL